MRTDPWPRFPIQIDQNDIRPRNVISSAHQLLGKFAASFTHSESTKGAIARMTVRTQNHFSASGHHFPVIAVYDGHIGRNINTSVFMRRTEGKHMVIFVDCPAYGTKAVMTVCQNIWHRKFLHTARSRGLDDAHIGNIMAGHAVKAHFQMIHITGLIMRFQNMIGDGSLQCFFFRDRASGFLSSFSCFSHNLPAFQQINARVKKLHHDNLLLLIQGHPFRQHSEKTGKPFFRKHLYSGLLYTESIFSQDRSRKTTQKQHIPVTFFPCCFIKPIDKRSVLPQERCSKPIPFILVF